MPLKNYIGLACTGHENALAIVDSRGHVVFAEATERYIQTKRAINTPADDPIRFPKLAERYCEPGAELVVARSWSGQAEAKMKADAARMLKALVGCDPRADREWIKRVMFQSRMWDDLVGPNVQLAGTGVAAHCMVKDVSLRRRDFPHHLTHAAYGCYTSPFEDAVCAVFDGYGEGDSYAYFVWEDNRLRPLEYTRSSANPYGSLSSLGMFYGHTICALFGFPISNGEEWKVMGLAPYGKIDPELLELLERHILVDGLDIVLSREAKSTYLELQRYRKRAEQTYEDVANIAHTGQHHFSQILFTIFGRLAELELSSNVVFTGGCALNSSFSGRLLDNCGFERLYIPPAPSDDGNAVGAALLAFAHDNPTWRPERSFHSPYLGSAMDDASLDAFERHGGALGRVNLEPDAVIAYAAEQLSRGRIVAWVQGQAEFGPRALGNRSILADPREASMKDRINAVVKYREGFRPFAPSILHEHGDEYFVDYSETPYMEKTLTIRPSMRERIPAVTHADGTGRVQTVKAEWNPRYHALLREFYRRTGVPVVLNTSLNVMGKPIVHTAGDAFTLYQSSGVDVLVIGDRVFDKASA